MAESKYFSLRWNNFHNNLREGFHSLLEEIDLVDVTLAAEGQYLQAHKTVLSVCSPYFRQLFKANPCKHPIVIMKDVCFKDLKSVLLFMYQGEVNICEEELGSFLKTAEMLQIKGLSENYSKPNESSVSPVQSPSLLQKSLGSEFSDSYPRQCKRPHVDSSPKGNSSLAVACDFPAVSETHRSLPALPFDHQPSPQESKIDFVPSDTKQEPADITLVEDEAPTHIMQLLSEDEGRPPASKLPVTNLLPDPSQVSSLGLGQLQDIGCSQDSSEGVPASERKVMQARYHELHLSASRGRSNGRVRKRCVYCYETNRRMLGCRVANQKTLKVSTFCGTCPKFPFMCVNCFKIHVNIKEDLG